MSFFEFDDVLDMNYTIPSWRNQRINGVKVEKMVVGIDERRGKLEQTCLEMKESINNVKHIAATTSKEVVK